MAKRGHTDMQNILKNFFKGDSEYLPMACYYELGFDKDSSKDYYAISISLKKGKNVVGDIYTKLQNLGFDILSFQTHVIDGSNIAYTFAEVDGALDDISGIMEAELVKLQFVKDCRAKKFDREGFNPFGFPTTIGKDATRAFNVVYGFFHAMIRTIPNSLGSGGEYLLYQAGVNTADFVWNYFEMNKIGDFDGQFVFLEDLFRTFGMGILSFEDIDPLLSKGKVIVKESIEACYGKNCSYWGECEQGKLYQARSAHCTFIKSFLSEILRKIFEDNMIDLVEVECISRGNKTCIYELSRPREI
ncbi:MAG: hypothetical protein ACXQTP_01450 [Candidatus Methanofastidiosia archaeon]